MSNENENEKAKLEKENKEAESKKKNEKAKLEKKNEEAMSEEELDAKYSKYIKYIAIAIVVLILITVIGILNINRNKNVNQDDGITKIVTSFYPMYVIAENLVDGAINVELTNMTDVNVGCLHDYTLKTEDIKKVENADIFISNGLGMESFIGKLIEANQDMDVIDSSVSIENPISHENETNPHIWTSIDNYLEQVQTVAIELKRLDPENEAIYEANRRAYIAKLNRLKNEFNNQLEDLKDERAICLNEAFEYMAKDIGLQLTSIQTDHEESTMSAETLRNIIDIANSQDIKIIIIDKNDNRANAETIANETDAEIYVLNSGLTGNLDKDAYINAMKENIEILKSAN